MKNFKKFLFISLCTLLTVSPLSTKANATEQTPKEIPQHIQELIDLNSEGFNEFFKQVDLNSDFAVHGESYIKVFESAQGNIIDDREYSKEEYLNEIIKPTPYAVVQPVNWLQLEYSIYPVYGSTTKIGVSAAFTWLKKPNFYGKDLITISTDTNYVTPGSLDMVNAAFWPNISCPNVVGTYRNGTTLANGEFEFDSNGVTFKNYLASNEFANEIKKVPNYSDYFVFDSIKWFSTGCPKLSMSTILTKSNSTTTNGKILFTYNHQQVSINYNPGISVSAEGTVKVTGGITGSLGFDTASVSKNYTYGEQIW